VEIEKQKKYCQAIKTRRTIVKKRKKTEIVSAIKFVIK